MKEILMPIGLLCIVLLCLYGAWSCKRRMNYNWSYESMVQEQIQKNLKPINARMDAIEIQLNRK